ncbi:MAG TPA: lysylphosphatidylglycerol synthase domain-containing protein [Candidatus Sabulitectum sp.]|nr:lysylphosphatidylglycerol synthase domain-containing protein [Candidatus Sabulitectum sp.]
MKFQHVRKVSAVLLGMLTAAAVLALLRNGSSLMESLKAHTWTLDWLKLAGSAALLAVALFLTPQGWVIICRSMGSTLGNGTLRSAWFASQLGRYVPGKVWLFAGRAGFLKSRGMSGGRAAATTLYELLFSFASVGLIALAAFGASPDLMSGGGMGTVAAAAGAALLVIPLLHPVQRAVCRRKGISPDSLPCLSTALKAVSLYTMLWLLRGMSIYLLLSGTGIEPVKLFRSLAAAPLSWLAGYIVVIVPGGIGIREAAAAAIAAPGSEAPAAAALAGHRLFMAAVELALAAFTAKKIIKKEGNDTAEG